MNLLIIVGCVAAGLLLGGWLHRHARRRPAPVVVPAPVAAGIPEAAGAPKAVGAPVNKRVRSNTGASRFDRGRGNIRAMDLSFPRGPGRPGWPVGRRR